MALQTPEPWPPGCPWSGFATPTIRFCENNVCGWIAQPANAWSNLIYVLLGLYIWRVVSREFERGSALRWVGPIEILVGICSFAFHATYTLWGELLDLSAMFLFSTLLFVFNARRMGWVSKAWELRTFIVVLLTNVLALMLAPAAGIGIFTGVMVLVGVLELVLYWKNRGSGVSYRKFWIGNAFLVAAQIIWQLDIHGVVCAPDEHVFQGHAAWHILNSFCFFFALKHYAQFRELRQAFRV